MKKTELIKKAINQRVVIESWGSTYIGWLVVDNERKDHYAILPFENSSKNIFTFRVSHIQHIKFISNGHRLW